MEELTHYNNHTEAYIVGCKIIGDPAKTLQQRFDLIARITALDGCIEQGIYEYRYTQYQALKELAKIHLTADQFERFYHAT